jgi:NAD-dependent deacetylase sirtuin 4
MKKQEITTFLNRYSSGRILFLTGAGISTDSGIPDYRGPNGVYVRNKQHKPITYQQFVSSNEFRQRYWARSFLGWPKIVQSEPNAIHHWIAHLQKENSQHNLITQNVDGLHELAGSNTIQMHGTLKKVVCLQCHSKIDRIVVQSALKQLNPFLSSWAQNNPNRFSGDVASSVNPDGDVELSWDYSNVQYPHCTECRGLLKPDVVFFGENMDSQVRNLTFKAVNDADALFVLGTSLTVYSAFRLVKLAHERGIPIVIANYGPTRGDHLASLKFDGKIGEII